MVDKSFMCCYTLIKVERKHIKKQKQKRLDKNKRIRYSLVKS
jgi:hypothetical protein